MKTAHCEYEETIFSLQYHLIVVFSFPLSLSFSDFIIELILIKYFLLCNDPIKLFLLTCIMLRFTVILLIFLTNVSLPVNGVINLAAFQQEALLQHNVRRQQHCVPPLTLNSSLNTIAQNYANFLAVNGLFNHSATAGLGENLWSLWTSGVLGNINGQDQQSSPGYSSLLFIPRFDSHGELVR